MEDIVISTTVTNVGVPAWQTADNFDGQVYVTLRYDAKGILYDVLTDVENAPPVGTKVNITFSLAPSEIVS